MIWEMVPLYPVLGSDQGLVNLKKSLKSFPIELHRISHFEKGALFAKVIAFYSPKYGHGAQCAHTKILIPVQNLSRLFMRPMLPK